MAQSRLYTGPSLQFKVSYPSSTTPEKVVGFVSNLQFSVSHGQKLIYGVDSPFPVEIAQAAGPSAGRGSLTLYLPLGSNLEVAGLVPYRTDDQGQIHMAASRYINFRIYDRFTSALVLSADYAKVSGYSVNVSARQVVAVQVQFEAQFLTPGNASSS